jgi:hypothetical protein
MANNTMAAIAIANQIVAVSELVLNPLYGDGHAAYKIGEFISHLNLKGVLGNIGPRREASFTCRWGIAAKEARGNDLSRTWPSAIPV